MMMNGTWSFQSIFGSFEEAGQEWDWFPMPPISEWAKPVYALSVGTTLSINAATEHPAEAAMVLDWVFNDKQRTLRIASEGYGFGEWMVPLKYAASDFPADTDERVVRFFEDYSAVTGRGDYGYTTWTHWPAKTEVYMRDTIDEVLAGTLTPEEFMAEKQKIFDEEMESGKTPPIPVREM